MDERGWLADTRESYDVVASSYADFVRRALDGQPYLLAALALFADAVRGSGGGPVADLGCGPGHVTAHLHDLGLDAFGIDLSPGMVEVARRDHPELRFEVGSMTGLALPEDSLGGAVAFWSLIHIPDDEVPGVLAGVGRALRPGGHVLVGFHVGDGVSHKTEGYGGHPMNVHIHRRTTARMTGILIDAGFDVTAELVIGPAGPSPGALIFARSR